MGCDGSEGNVWCEMDCIQDFTCNRKAFSLIRSLEWFQLELEKPVYIAD